MATLLELGSVIRAERKRRKITQQQLAVACHIHRNTLASLESGKGNVELSTFLAVCVQLDLPIQIVPKGTAA